MSTPTETIIPEIDEIVNFYKPELVDQIAKDEGFVQRESTLGGIEFLAIMTYGLFSQPDASLNQMVAPDGSNAKRHQSPIANNSIGIAPKDKSVRS